MKNLLSKLEKINLDRPKVFLIILVCLPLLYVDFNFILRMQIKSIGSANTKALNLKKDIANFNLELESLDKQKKTQVKSLLKPQKILPENQKQELAQHIYDTATDYKVKVIQLKPGFDPKAKEELYGKLKLAPISITLDLSCGYHEFGGFLNALENGKYFVALTDLRITRNPGDIFHHHVNLVLKAYVKK